MRTLALLLLTIITASCTAQSAGEKGLDPYADVSNEEAKALIDSLPDLQIIDVRQDAEVAEGMIPGAVQMDISKPAFDEQIATLDKEKPVLVYCAAGGRSKTAQEVMQEMGFKQVYNLKRGYGRWK